MAGNRLILQILQSYLFGIYFYHSGIILIIPSSLVLAVASGTFVARFICVTSHPSRLRTAAASTGNFPIH